MLESKLLLTPPYIRDCSPSSPYVINLCTFLSWLKAPLALMPFFPLSSRGFFGVKLHCGIVFLTTLHLHVLCTYVVVGT